MSESHKEQIARVNMMATGLDDTWDLSDNDCAALCTVLKEREVLLEALKKYMEYFGDPANGVLIGARAAIAKAEGRDTTPGRAEAIPAKPEDSTEAKSS